MLSHMESMFSLVRNHQTIPPSGCADASRLLGAQEFLLLRVSAGTWPGTLFCYNCAHGCAVLSLCVYFLKSLLLRHSFHTVKFILFSV